MHAGVGDVAGGQLLELRVGTSRSRRRAHSGDGSGAYGSSLDDGGVVGLSSTTRRVTQVARAQATLAIGDRVCSLTTVQCGATAPSVIPRFSVQTPSTRLDAHCVYCKTISQPVEGRSMRSHQSFGTVPAWATHFLPRGYLGDVQLLDSTLNLGFARRWLAGEPIAHPSLSHDTR